MPKDIDNVTYRGAWKRGYVAGRARSRTGEFNYPIHPYHNTALNNRWHEGYDVGAKLPERACPHWNTARQLQGTRICGDCRAYVAVRPREELT